jgi:hypothetical protein
MKNIRSILLVLSAVILIALVSLTTAPGSAPKRVRDDSKYRVFCADNKLEVEQRTLEQEKSARGSNVCMMAEFDYLSDAESYAEHHGGKGSECRCD